VQRLGFLLEVLGAERLAEVVHAHLPPKLKQVPLELGVPTGRQSVLHERWLVLADRSIGIHA
jgi:hypothetical protein